ncbi:MAG: hypothetical protein LKJ88_06615 [Bacilli bacterium]|jgi:hypothetical protein|nr:hypothetical protein [Bacilli bacterium]
MAETVIIQRGLKKVGKKLFIEGDYVDLFIRIGASVINQEHQFKRIHSAVYDCDEFVWRGLLTKGKVISFTHADNRELPDPNVYNQISGPGMTFSGAEACADLSYKDALVCPVQGSDLIYNFIDGDSELSYVGKTGTHTIFVRVYDNNSGTDNDRWLVVSME